MTHPAPPAQAVSVAPQPRRRSVARAAALTAALTFLSLLAAVAWSTSSAAANPPMPHDPIGTVEHFRVNPDGSAHVIGWAGDPDTTANLHIAALIDSKTTARTTTNIARPAIAKKNHTSPTPGFNFSVKVPASGVHVLCVVVRNVGVGTSRVLGCTATPLGTTLDSTQLAARSPKAVVSSATTSTTTTATTLKVSGWSADPDFTGAHLVGVLYVDGQSAQTLTTRTATRAQVKAGSGTYGAFSFSVPVTSGAHLACVWLVNIGLGWNTSPGCTAVDTRGAAGTGKLTTPAINKKALAEAKKHIGQRYVWGAEGPKTFDCSGLVMYSYHKAGFTTPRIAQDQFAAARVIPANRAVPGDLVFYHDSVGAVYHVGIYVKPLDTIAAIDEQEGIAHQPIWDPSSATYGSFTHT